MALEFAGTGAPLSDAAFSDAADRTGSGKAEIWAILTVESPFSGFLKDRRPQILFEQHRFSSETNGQYNESNADISNPNSGNYGPGGSHQYDRLGEAIKLDRIAALRSTSWGIAQILGSNFKSAGFDNVENMVAQMVASEDSQLSAMVAFLLNNGLRGPLLRHDWTAFAKGYNGPGYAKNNYDQRLRANYEKCSVVLPGLDVRAAQIYLRYLGYPLGIVDGILGPKTADALTQFQKQQRLPLTPILDQDTLNNLTDEVAKLP